MGKGLQEALEWAARAGTREAVRETAQPGGLQDALDWAEGKSDDWQFPGDAPDYPINEEHPEMGTLDRLKIMNVTGGRDPVAIHNLQKKYGYEVHSLGEPYDYSLRKPGGKWHRFDPKKGFFSSETLKDIADSIGGMFTFGTSVAGAVPGFALGTAGGGAVTGGNPIGAAAGGFTGASVGSGIGGAAGETVLTELGKSMGMEFPEGEQVKAIGTEGAVNLIGEGAGRVGAKVAGKAYRGLVPQGVRESIAEGATRLNPWAKEAVGEAVPPPKPAPGAKMEQGDLPGFEPPPPKPRIDTIPEPTPGGKRVPGEAPEAAPAPKTVKEVKEMRARAPVSPEKAGISRIEAEKAFPGFRSLRRSPRTEKRGKLGDVVKATFGWLRRSTNKEGRKKGTQDWITGTFHQADPAYAGLEKPFYKSQKAFNEVLKEQGYAGKGSLAKLQKLIEDRGLGEFLEQGIKDASPAAKRKFYKDLLFDAQPGKHKGKPFEHSEDFIHLWSEEPHRMSMAQYLKTGDPKHLGYRRIAWADLTDIIDPETGIHYAVDQGIPLRPTKGLGTAPKAEDIQKALEGLTGRAEAPRPPPVTPEPVPRPPPPPQAPMPPGTGLQTGGPGLQPRGAISDWLEKKGFELSEFGPWSRTAKQAKRGFHPVLRAFGGGIAPRLGAFGALGGVGYSIGGTPGAVIGGSLALGGGKALSKLAMAAERFAGRRMKGLGHLIANNEQAIATLAEGAMLPPHLRKLVQGALNMRSRGPTAWRAAAYTLSHHPDFRSFVANQIGNEE